MTIWRKKDRPRRAPSNELHAHEITPNDAAVIRMMGGSQWGDDATLTLPSGKTITGTEMRRWAETEPEDMPTSKDTPRMTAFREATLDEYAAWLRAWLAAGNQPTHYYDRPFGRERWLTAERDFTTGGECGARSVHIIVPAGVEHVSGGLGHNNLYYMDGPRQVGRNVPIFNDPVLRALSDVIPAFIEAEKVKKNAWRREMEARKRLDDRRSLQSDVGRYFHRDTEQEH